MKNQKKIAILITYYGSFPWYITYFFHSCKYNPSIDFFIITDIKKPPYLSDNIKFINISLHQISEIAKSKLGFSVNIKSPYKLCDFKPAYGFLFNDIIKKYDFWGHGDLDVIYGNIRNFMTDEILSTYDVITITADYISGAFTLFKNSKKSNELFMHSKDYKKVFKDSKHFCFDETNGIFLPFFDGVPAEDVLTDIDSMTHVVKREQKQKYIKAYFNTHVLEGLPGRIKWQDGVLIYKGKIEAMMFHMLLYKHVYKPKKIPMKIPDSFYINAPMKLMYQSKPLSLSK